MANVRIKVPGVPGKIEARALKLRQAIAGEMERFEASRQPKPAKPIRKTFAHIRDFREVGR